MSKKFKTKFLYKPGVYLKFIDLLLCLVGTVIMSDASLYLFENRIGESEVTTALAGGLITSGVMIIIYILDEEHHITGMIFLFTHGLLNLVAAILLLVEKVCYSGRGQNLLLLAMICALVSLFMLADFGRELRAEIKAL